MVVGCRRLQHRVMRARRALIHTRSMQEVGATEVFFSYYASDFDATCRFYVDVLGCERGVSWDRADGRGAYFNLSGSPVVEVLGSAHLRNA